MIELDPTENVLRTDLRWSKRRLEVEREGEKLV